jgi:hypothetical protein
MRDHITKWYVATAREQSGFAGSLYFLSILALKIVLIQVERELFLNSISGRVCLFTAEQGQWGAKLHRALEVVTIFVVCTLEVTKLEAIGGTQLILRHVII